MRNNGVSGEFSKKSRSFLLVSNVNRSIFLISSWKGMMRMNRKGLGNPTIFSPFRFSLTKWNERNDGWGGVGISLLFSLFVCYFSWYENTKKVESLTFSAKFSTMILVSYSVFLSVFSRSLHVEFFCIKNGG